MKIKIIDLFVKIANKENVPKKLLYKYKNKDFYGEYLLEWSDKHKTYFYVSDNDGESYPITGLLAANFWNLNDELEILEEKTILPNKIDFSRAETQKEKNKLIKDTINQIIDYLKKEKVE